MILHHVNLATYMESTTTDRRHDAQLRRLGLRRLPQQRVVRM